MSMRDGSTTLRIYAPFGQRWPMTELFALEGKGGEGDVLIGDS